MGSLYSDRRTWLHAVPAGWKLAVIALAGTGLFLLDRPWPLLAGAAAGVAVFASLGAACRQARKLVVSVVIAGLLVIAFQAAMGPWQLGVASALRLLGVALLGAAYTLTTRYDESLHVLERLLATWPCSSPSCCDGPSSSSWSGPGWTRPTACAPAARADGACCRPW